MGEASRPPPTGSAHTPSTRPSPDDLGTALHFVSREQGLAGSHCRFVPWGGPRWDWRELGGTVLTASLRLPSEGGRRGGRGAGGLPLVLAAGSPSWGGHGHLPGLGIRIGSGLRLLHSLCWARGGRAHILRSQSGTEGPARGSGALCRGSHPFVVVFPELVGSTRHKQRGLPDLPGAGSCSSWACHGTRGHWLTRVAGIHCPTPKELCNTPGHRRRAQLPGEGHAAALGLGRGQEVCLDRYCTLTDCPPGLRGAVTHTAHRLHNPGLARLLLADQEGVLCAAGPFGSSWP